MARQYDVDDSEWDEVKYINGYALFMGYMMMGVRGLDLLVLTWTTVVRLAGSGSGSNLGNKDFWCLTGIVLIQTAGVFDFLLKEKISDIVQSWWGLVFTVLTTISEGGKRRLIISLVTAAIHLLVFGVISCALVVFYILGMCISAGVALWRLIEHDFGDAGGANQRPALQVVYILAVAQGVLFGYKTIYGFLVGRRLASNVVAGGRSSGVDNVELVEEYIKETVAGCEKDPSFATGRNFVTYGVDLMMEAKSSQGFLAGIKVLGGTIKNARGGQKVLAKYLLTRPSDSSSAIIERLLETVGPRSPYSKEIKELVLHILDIIARCIPLEQFPRAIECLCSLVDPYEGSHRSRIPYDDNKFKDYKRVELLDEYEKFYAVKELNYGRRVENEIKEERRGFDQRLVKAVNILYKLITDEDNERILRTCVPITMLGKIVKFPKKLHRENHYPCHLDQKSELQMLEQCWVLTDRLLGAMSETSSLPLQPASPVGEGRQRRRREEIGQEVEESEETEEEEEQGDGSTLGSSIKSTIKQSIETTIRNILDCPDCRATQKRQAILILFHLSLDMDMFLYSQSRRRRLCWILLLILICSDVGYESEYWKDPRIPYPNPNNNYRNFNGIRTLAVQKLSDMHPEVHGLHLLHQSERESRLIDRALEDLGRAFYDDAQDSISIRTNAVIIMEGLCQCRLGTDYPEVEKFLVDAIPEVVNALWRTETAGTQGQATVERGNVSLYNNRHGRIGTQRLQKALASLCYFGYDSVIPNYNLSREFRRIAREKCEEQEKSFKDFYRLIRQSIK